MDMEGMDTAAVTIMDMVMVDMAGTEGMVMEVMAVMAATVGDTDTATDMGMVTHHTGMGTPLTDMVMTILPMDTVMEALDTSTRGAWVKLSRCT